jgi:hypothetical protein
MEETYTREQRRAWWCSIAAAGAGEPVMVFCGNKPLQVEEVAYVNGSGLRTKSGLMFSRRKGLGHGNLVQDLRAELVKGFSYSKRVADINCQSLRDPSAPIKHKSLVNEEIENLNGVIFWYYAVMTKAHLKVYSLPTGQVWTMSLVLTYRVLYGPLLNMERRAKIRIVVDGERVAVDYNFINSLFEAEETEFYDNDPLEPAFFMEHLGRRPVKIQFGVWGRESGLILAAKEVRDSVITRVLRWKVDAETGAATPVRKDKSW